MIPPRNSFCFAASHNTPAHSFDSPNAQHIPHEGGDPPTQKMAHDASAVFLPYMESYRRLYSQDGGIVTTLAFEDNLAPHAARRRQALDALRAAPSGIDAVAYFGHGFPHGMASVHIYNSNIAEFAGVIRAKCVPGVKIILYACSCGRRSVSKDPPCFAARLADALSDMRAEVYGHDVAGHACTNYTVFRFPGCVQVAPPGTYGAHGAFKRALKAHGSTLWARFPFMTPTELAAEVR